MRGKGNDGTGNNKERDLWETNQELWESLNNQYKFLFDCCASSENTKTEMFSEDFEKVKKVNGVAWMNPPFSNARRMFEHFFNVIEKGIAIYRIDNPETKIWQEVIFPNASWIFIPKGRILYTPYNVDIRSGVTRFPSALIGVNLLEVKDIKGITLKVV